MFENFFFLKKTEKLQDHHSHKIKDKKILNLLEFLVEKELKDIEKKQSTVTVKPCAKSPESEVIKHSRYVPIDLKRRVFERAEHKCEFKGTNGRCCSRWMLEIEHVIPFAKGGETSFENLIVLCKTHNQYTREKIFGAFVPKDVKAAFY